MKVVAFAVTSGLQPGLVADMEAEQQHTAEAQHPPEVAKDRGDLVVWDMKQ